ncbi:LOW QUALITY PROTEIN: hypothetical protein PHPALM_29715 [Phytophthora palmivora]|uniref:Uncharacterized protein n=1 Tax=Phytophthora palmivora TaxID=4796 RepID=A0A2P4X6X7_9STRA|nr:LOW QUALITY PROTEIN: hypothetical protein PHPALM_29715 [Phytophthora palmivora]
MADAESRIRESRLKVVILSNLPSGWLSSLGAHGSSRRFGRAAPSGSSSGLIPALILPGVALMGIVVASSCRTRHGRPEKQLLHSQPSWFGMNRRSGNYYGTICAKLCAVCWRHCFECDYDPGVSAQHTLLLRGITDSQPTFSCNNPSRRVYFAGYTHIWTSHELAINCCGQSRSTCEAALAITVAFLLCGAKNNQFGRQEFRVQHLTYDVVVKAAKIMSTRQDKPVLKMSQRGGVSSTQVATVIKTAASEAGLDTTRFSIHSVGIGGTTKLLNAGVDRLVI